MATKTKKKGAVAIKNPKTKDIVKFKGADFVMYNVKDLNKAVDFYKNVLGLEPYGDPGESWAEFQVGNITLDLGTFDKDAIGNGAAVGLAVDNVEETLEELKQRGVKVVYELYETPVCFGATIADPDGNKIHIHKRKDGTFGD